MSRRRRLRVRRAVVAAAVCALAVAPSAGQAPAGSRVLILPFATTVDPGTPGGPSAALWLGEAAAILLAERLELAGASALSRDDRVALFDRLRLPLSAALTRATMMRIGELVGATEIVFGQVRLGGAVEIRAELIRIPDRRAAPGVTESAPLAELMPLGARVGDRLAALVGPQPPAAPVRRSELPFAAFENYVKGLVAAMPAAAQRFLESAMTLAPHDGRVLTALWSVYADQGLHEKALGAASAVAADSPESAQARLNGALSLIELKRYDGAERMLTALGKERPTAAVWNALGIIALRRPPPGPAGAAVAHFARAVADEPSVTDYHFNLGYARALGHDVAGAILALREAVRRNTADADAHLVLSALLGGAGKSSEAAREFELARLLGPSLDPPPATVPASVPPGLERVSSDLDRPVFTALEAEFERTLPRLGTAYGTYLVRGQNLSKAGQDLEAVIDLRRAIYLAPNDDQAHLALGRLYQRTGRLADAIDEFKVAIWCRETAAGRVALGSALLDSGDREAARREATRALAIAPESAEARELMRRIDGGTAPLEVRPSADRIPPDVVVSVEPLMLANPTSSQAGFRQ
jgi:tetratricopeptide (TPR) repeat protein